MSYGNLPGIFIGILGALIWSITYFKVGKKAQVYLPKNLSKGRRTILRTLVFALGLISWGFLSFSLGQPRKPLGLTENNIEVNDIFFVVDVSKSMLAEDFKPNRLEAAKSKITEFVKLRPRDRIGIIMFSEKAFTLLPLSTDLKLIEQIISEINVGFLGSGTNIGDAIALAVARGAQSLAENKVIILLTDGVSNVGSMTPIQAAQEAKEQKIKVYTIGMGGREDARIPVGRTLFGRKQYQTIPGGSIDTKTLQDIASITGAKYYLAQNDQALKDVLLEIEKLERTEIESSGRVIYKELYLKYLFIGVIGLLLAELSRRFVIKEAM
ncbi:MAG: VWA domain-containing protein [Deltaproteobacteria bacterium]|nr:MAG: VWA domain-containing protein [Deltaproteobacteria bacterium]